jgi:hypothetical protein
MIKVICIKNDGWSQLKSQLTINKVYDAKLIQVNSGDYYYGIISDIGIYIEYNIDRFITLADWRQQQINGILNED